MFFRILFFIGFCDFECPEIHFGYHFDSILEALGLWKNSWKCVTVIKFTGLTSSRHTLFAGLDGGCVLILGFCSFFQFWAVSRFPFGDLLVPYVVKKEFWKKMRKVVKKGSAGKPGPGAVGPSKQDNRQQTSDYLDIGSNTPWRAWRHGGGYIYIYI